MRVGALALLLAAPGALAATIVDGIAVQPNPAVLSGKGPLLVEISVSVNRGQFDRQACNVVIEPGDGGKPLLLTFVNGDKRKKVRYTYSEPGAYAVKAAAGTGCSGTRSVTLAVRAGDVPAQDVAVHASSEAAPGGCPAGWYVEPESVQGARYVCRPNLPPAPLHCTAGTRYFAEYGAIGCR
jgi:hypothetical protein